MSSTSEAIAADAHTLTLEGGYTISDARGRLDMDFVHASISSSYWAIDRPRALTERSWANSLCAGLYDSAGDQIGFARALTDYALRAHIADVYVDRDRRGLGLGKSLFEFILYHPALKSVSRWTLTTADAQSLYAKYGFQAGKADTTWMTLQRRAG